MATINGTSVGGMTLQAEYSYTQNTTANTSSVTVTLKLVNHYALYATALTGSYISVGGSKTNYTKSISYGGSTTTTTTLATKTATVTHNSDGTATCNISGTFVINGTYRGSSVGTMTVSQTITLPKIARSSSFTVSSSVNTGSAISGTVTPSSTAFNHKIQLKIGATVKDTITMAVGTTAFSYTIPHSWFPSSTSGTVTAVLQTYNGTTLVASTSKNITANVPTSVVPAVSAFTAAIAASGLGGLYVQGKTTAKLTATATAGSGSTIKSYTFSGSNVTSSGNSTTITANTVTTAAIKTAGTVTYTVKVQDNRGRTASKTVSITVYPYAVPSIGPVSVQRCDSSGNISQSGTYAKYTVNSSYSSVGSKNTRTVTVAYSSNNGTSYSAETTLQAATDTAATKSGIYGGGAFAIASTYVIRFTIKDAYGATKTITAPLQSAARPINIRSNGKGVAIGGMSTKDAFEVSMPADFNSSVNIDGATTINNAVAVTGVLNSKNHIYMGGAFAQTGELQVKFSNPTTSANPHHAYLYGGNPNSTTAIGMYDALNARGIFQYADGANRVILGNSNAEIYFNGSKVADFVVQQGTQGDWTYRKWNNGFAECWRNVSVTPSNVNANNSITMDLPFAFANTNYNVTITPAKAAMYIDRWGDCATNGTITHTATTFTMAYNYAYGTAYAVSFNIVVNGKWK
ncbi:MAG: DUF859 family phage minor structural protein [Paludibacteraceae bacterium]|nr:DUF859 family phage minor structural protein [Paludibacteraceae bacterium]